MKKYTDEELDIEMYTSLLEDMQEKCQFLLKHGGSEITVELQSMKDNIGFGRNINDDDDKKIYMFDVNDSVYIP